MSNNNNIIGEKDGNIREIDVNDLEEELNEEPNIDYLRINELREKVDDIINKIPALQDSINQISFQTRRSVEEIKQELLSELNKSPDTSEINILNRIITHITELNQKLNSIVNQQKIKSQPTQLADFWDKPIPDFVNDITEIAISVYKVKNKGEIEKVYLPGDNGEITLPITKNELVELIKDISGAGKYSLRARHIPTGKFIGYKALTIENDTPPVVINTIDSNSNNNSNNKTNELLLEIIQTTREQIQRQDEILRTLLTNNLTNNRDDTLNKLLIELIKRDNNSDKGDSKIIEIMNTMWRNQLELMKQNFENTIKMLQKSNNGVSMEDVFKNVMQMMTELEKTKLNLQLDERKYIHEKEMKKMELDYQLKEQGKYIGDLEEKAMGTRILEEKIDRIQKMLKTPEQKKDFLDSLGNFLGKIMSVYNTMSNPKQQQNQNSNNEEEDEEPFIEPEEEKKQPFRNRPIREIIRYDDEPKEPNRIDEEVEAMNDEVETIIDLIPLEDTDEREDGITSIREEANESTINRVTDNRYEYNNEQDNAIRVKQIQDNRDDISNKSNEQGNEPEEMEDNASQEETGRDNG